MSTPDRHYWKPRELAEHLGLDTSTVYKKIEKGEIKALRIGAKALRIPKDEVERILSGVAEQRAEPRALADRVARFEQRTGMEIGQFIELWRSGQVEDTPENAREAIEALALREALRGMPVPA